jgi:hypothetical protein
MPLTFEELRQHGLRAATAAAADAVSTSDRVRSLVGQLITTGVVRNVGLLGG